ncbi:hypothetical protein Rhopal_001091-T1 [Rhodotorula paludigena]|uniref:SH3 domain-containing protein n=1 Tax=Rhodotorula paludigena TaxID=86838 RepID=A0AAV5GEF7_9BASI|nr:hypothetical protein Rhopal_001091-T1 [Rhodotorula paludigena]
MTKSLAESGRSQINKGFDRVDARFPMGSGAGAGSRGRSDSGSSAAAAAPSPGGLAVPTHSSYAPPPPPSRGASSSSPAPAPAPPPRGPAPSSAAAGARGVFSGMDSADKEAFFALLDEYFASRPQFAALFQQGGASTPAPAPAAAPQRAIPAAAAPPRGVGSAVALYDFEGAQAEDLPFHEGDQITVLEVVSDDWLKGELRGRTGIFPRAYVEMQG